MRWTLILPAMGLLALATVGCNNTLSQPGGGPTPTSAAAAPGAAQSTLNAGGQAGGPLVPGNYPPAPAQSGTTAPAAAPAAAPPPMREFVVYFDFDKATLTPEAHSIIGQAAASAKQAPMTHIAVTGHTDTVGTDQHNQGLSERRAAAVQQALVAQGVPADQIATSGVGKTQLAVPTADNVNEPRNRRVVISEGGPGA